MSEAVVLARVVRSGVEESVHLGHVVACDADGRVIAVAGDPERVLFARSSMKPVQASASLRHIPDDLSREEIALMCGSHNAEPAQVERVMALLRRAELGAKALRCPPAWPRAPEDARAARDAAPEFHNCSGKHAGMLLACRRAGFDAASYVETDHPLQLQIRELASELAGTAPLAEGVDGCGVPVHAFPLRALALIFARIPGAGGELLRAVDAMRAAPDMVAGRDRLDTALMQAAPGLVVKSGAEGLVCAAAPHRVGIAVRVDDGSPRATAPALVRTLRLLHLLPRESGGSIPPFEEPPVLGGGAPVGSIRSDFELRSS